MINQESSLLLLEKGQENVVRVATDMICKIIFPILPT